MSCLDKGRAEFLAASRPKPSVRCSVTRLRVGDDPSWMLREVQYGLWLVRYSILFDGRWTGRERWFPKHADAVEFAVSSWLL